VSDLVLPGESPFDAIRRVDEHGEHWTGRDLMPVMGYDRWQRFEEAIKRAMVACRNAGVDPDTQFSQVSELTGAGNLGAQERGDYRLTRYAAYLVAMNGDPRKPEIAAAQTYFAVKTREAETRQAERAPAVITLDVDEYERLLDGGKQMVAKIREQQAQIEAQQQELDEVHAYADDLEEDAEAFRNIVKDDGRDFSVRKTAGFLRRSDPRIDIGQNQLFEKLRKWELIDRWNEPYRKWSRYVTSMPKKFTDPHTGERRWAPKDQVRITWAGLALLRRKLIEEIEAAAAERRRTQEPDLFSQPHGDNVRSLPARRDDTNPEGVA
jgi:DNA-damage-inducible protein D